MSQEDYEKQKEIEKLLENDRNQRINQVEQLQNQNFLKQERLNQENLWHQEKLLHEQNTIQFEKEMDDRIFQLRMTLAQTSDTLSRNDLQALLNEEEAKRDCYYAEKEARRKAAELSTQELDDKSINSKEKKFKGNNKGKSSTLATIVFGVLTLVAVIILVTVYKTYKQKYITESSSFTTPTAHKTSETATTGNSRRYSSNTKSSVRSKKIINNSSHKVSSNKIEKSVLASSSMVDSSTHSNSFSTESTNSYDSSSANTSNLKELVGLYKNLKVNTEVLCINEDGSGYIIQEDLGKVWGSFNEIVDLDKVSVRGLDYSSSESNLDEKNFMPEFALKFVGDDNVKTTLYGFKLPNHNNRIELVTDETENKVYLFDE